MELKTKEHFSKLKQIFLDDGFLSLLDYDYQITRSRHKWLDFVFGGVEYLKAPFMTYVGDNFEREHRTKYYVVGYKDYSGLTRMTRLELR